MAFEQSVENIVNGIRDIESRRDRALIIREELSEKREESKVLIEKAELLINQDNSFTVTPKTCLRNVVNGTKAVPNSTFHQGSLSWDFEGMKREQGLPLFQNLGNEMDKMDIVITRMEKELKTKQTELELIQKEAQGQIKSEQYLRNTGRRHENTEPVGQQRMEMDYTTSRDENTFSPNRIQELQSHINAQNGKIEELSEKTNELEKHVSELEKQKEELLRVNHQWDEQYRLLKDDKTRAISEIQMKLKAQMACEEELQGQDVDFERLSQQKTMKIAELNREKEAFSQEIAKMREKQEKTDQLWVSAKKLIDEERDARYSATQQTQVIQERYKKLEVELQNSKQTQECLKTEIERLTAFYCSDRTSNGSPTPHGSPGLSSNVAEQIEVLKQQIRVYADDFSNERSDRERIQAEKEMLKEKNKACEDELALLKQQVRIYQDDFNRERQEKERLQRQLRDRRPVTVVQSPEEPWYVVPPQDYPAMGAANAHDRRQVQSPFMQERNFRRPPPYTPREMQEMAFHQQQQHHPRGNNALFHGCVPDRDVVDGVEAYQCPRCERKFSKQERRAFDEHIDKCTT